MEVKVEPPLRSPGADSSALDEPQVDHLVKLEESEDVEGEPNRLVKCFKLRIHNSHRSKDRKFFLHQLFFFPPCLKYFANRLFYFKLPGIA
jgi:hypothetical protein